MLASDKCLFWATNEEWFYFDDEDGEPHLTEKATEKAKKSFEAYQDLMKKSKETGICY